MRKRCLCCEPGLTQTEMYTGVTELRGHKQIGFP